MQTYVPTTKEEIADQIQYLHTLIYRSIEWANHIGRKPDQKELDSLYAEIAELEKK
jgi:hypothetical protein